MKRLAIFLLAIVLPVSVSSDRALAQNGNTLYGDFTVDESQVSPGQQGITFHIMLTSLSGRVIARQSITNNGRYRFLDIPNGEYLLIVEMDSKEVTRLPIRVMEPTKTDVRHDIALEWRDQSRGKAAAGVISVAEMYTRPAGNRARFEKALQAIKKKEDKEAISLLREVVASDPKDFIAWTELGTLYFKQSETGEAEKAYQSALAEKPTFLLALLNLGKVRLAIKNFDGAIEILTRAVAAQPLSADANFFLGEAYLQIKKGSKAVGYLYEALRVDPVGHAEAHLRLAALYKGAGLKDKAVAEYEQFLAKKPNYPDRKKIEQFISENKKQ